MARPEFVDHWTLFLADLLQNRKERDHDVRGTKGVRAYYVGSNKVAPGYSANWIPAPYGLHKVEVIPEGGYYQTSKYAETSYSYPNAYVSFAPNELY